MSEEAEESAPSAAGSGSGSGMIVVVDPDPISRSRAEDLEDDLDRQVIAIDSVDFDPDATEEVIEASVYVIGWDLGIRCGADLLEEIRRDPRLADKPVLVAFDAPTAARVRMALALGADGVCMKPYDASEIEALLAQVESAAGERAA